MPRSPAPVLKSALLLLLCACPKHKTDDSARDSDSGAGALPTLQLSFEAIPGNGFDMGGHVYDTSEVDYTSKAAFTSEILSAVVPGVMEATGASADLDQQLTPGGFELATSPSLQIRGPQDPAAAKALAASLGWTCYQWSVLVTNFAETDGGTGYGTVAFESGALTPELAQSFFEHAATVDPGLAGGYTAFGDELIFLNLRGTDGAPYSGLEDGAFITDLESATSSFTGATVSLSASGEVQAYLEENDWTGTGPTGEGYAADLSGEQLAALEPLREAYLTALEATGGPGGWIVTVE